MFINNKNKILTNNTKEILNILEKSLQESSMQNILTSKISYKKNILTISNNKIDLDDKSVFIISAGKSSYEMAIFFEKKLKQKIKGGFINFHQSLHQNSLKRISFIKASHPIPSKKSIIETKKHLQKIKNSINPTDIIIFLLSGGASSMLCVPKNNIEMDNFIRTQEILLNSGMEIDDINLIRKQISDVKGGGLLDYFPNNKIITVAVSDVISGNHQVIGSGPSVVSTHTTNCQKKDNNICNKIIHKHNLDLPKSIKDFLKNKKNHIEQITQNKNITKQKNKFILLSSPRDFAKIVKENSKKHGRIVKTKIMSKSSSIKQITKILLSEIKKERKGKEKIIIISSEILQKVCTTKGKGGRNQHLVLSLLLSLEKIFDNTSKKTKWSLLSFNTDGRDYIKGIGGAVIDNNTFNAMIKKNQDEKKIKLHLDNYDSYNILKKTDSLIKSDNTGINFCDIIIMHLV